VRQLAAAFEGGINLCKSIDCNQGASKLAHSKGFAPEANAGSVAGKLQRFKQIPQKHTSKPALAAHFRLLHFGFRADMGKNGEQIGKPVHPINRILIYTKLLAQVLSLILEQMKWNTMSTQNSLIPIAILMRIHRYRRIYGRENKMRLRPRILAIVFCIALAPLLNAAGRKVVIGEYFTATW
jgi:hypothetical protein